MKKKTVILSILLAIILIATSSFGLDLDKLSKNNESKITKNSVKDKITKELLFEILEKRFLSSITIGSAFQTLTLYNSSIIVFDEMGNPINTGSLEQDEKDGYLKLDDKFVLGMVLINSYGYDIPPQKNIFSAPRTSDGSKKAVAMPDLGDSRFSIISLQFSYFQEPLMMYYMSYFIHNNKNIKNDPHIQKISSVIQKWKEGDKYSGPVFDKTIFGDIVPALIAFASDFDKFVLQVGDNYITHKNKADEQKRLSKEQQKKALREEYQSLINDNYMGIKPSKECIDFVIGGLNHIGLITNVDDGTCQMLNMLYSSNIGDLNCDIKSTLQFIVDHPVIAVKTVFPFIGQDVDATIETAEEIRKSARAANACSFSN